MNKPKLKVGDTFILNEKMIEAKERSAWSNIKRLKEGMNMKVHSIRYSWYEASYKNGFRYLFVFDVVDDNINTINPLLYNLKR